MVSFIALRWHPRTCLARSLCAARSHRIRPTLLLARLLNLVHPFLHVPHISAIVGDVEHLIVEFTIEFLHFLLQFEQLSARLVVQWPRVIKPWFSESAKLCQVSLRGGLLCFQCGQPFKDQIQLASGVRFCVWSSLISSPLSYLRAFQHLWRGTKSVAISSGTVDSIRVGRTDSAHDRAILINAESIEDSYDTSLPFLS